MEFLTGTYKHTLDSKSRVLISNKLRSQIDAEEHGNTFYLMLGTNGVLCLYPEKHFKQVVLASAPDSVPADEVVDFERMSFALSNRLELDKQGRVLLSEQLRKRAGLGDDITLVGVRDHIEVWNTSSWEQYQEDHMSQFQKQITQARKEALLRQSQDI